MILSPDTVTITAWAHIPLDEWDVPLDTNTGYEFQGETDPQRLADRLAAELAETVWIGARPTKVHVVVAHDETGDIWTSVRDVPQSNRIQQ